MKIEGIINQTQGMQDANGKGSVYEVFDYYVLVFDVCSSSSILENLQTNDNLVEWKKFWEGINSFLKEKSDSNKFFINYKFVGDGFILLFDIKYINEIISFSRELAKFLNETLDELINLHVDTVPNRKGITIGIERGKLIRIDIGGVPEYCGKAINVAARLQASLKDPEHVNKALISKRVRNDIRPSGRPTIFIERERKLPNLFGDSRFYCYEMDLC